MTLETKLKKLREEWKICGGVNRKLIEQRARLLEWAIEKRDRGVDIETDKDIFGLR